MFDNLTPSQTNNSNQPGPMTGMPTSGQSANTPPVEPVDMFSAVKDIPAKPAAFQPKSSMPPLSDFNGSTADQSMKKYIVLSIIVLVIILIIAGGFISYKYFFPAATKTPVAEKQIINENKTVDQTPTAAETQNNAPVENQTNIVKEPSATTTATTSAALPAGNIDTDQDGLTDAEEKSLGTDPTKADTDNDGLFDREEVKVYKTNPLNADTDGDGFLDGDEVKKGYNPLGPGKLYEVNP